MEGAKCRERKTWKQIENSGSGEPGSYWTNNKDKSTTTIPIK